jgi:cell division FtsZ-interacting protein ZapD
MKKQRKYKIDEEMNKLNLPKYKAALKIIPEELGISFNTFHNYRKINIGDKADIPYELVRKLEKQFKLKEGQLVNFPIESKSLDALIREMKTKPKDDQKPLN